MEPRGSPANVVSHACSYYGNNLLVTYCVPFATVTVLDVEWRVNFLTGDDQRRGRVTTYKKLRCCLDSEGLEGNNRHTSHDQCTQ
ncbi:hypothetical protein PAXRUDRAFT_828555 [Paxillus rubicundulus Ve08.2h10]|uniref:Uncharacterized protein n=1 Tax=Paxillus rubicundulus Ve08.2h10 TaxID=930991 RepID=A0A0D0E154_9AGAM|nr:hypothetical protein PAXRUDRAFT_828555 [Paxillus rubicundulus Ve08.2h10]